MPVEQAPLQEIGGLVTLSALDSDEPNGLTWFLAASVPVAGVSWPVVFPRLVGAQTTPDEQFYELVQDFARRGALHALPLPRLVHTPSDLSRTRPAALKRAITIGTNAPWLEVPCDSALALLEGKRDRGRYHVVDQELEAAVGKLVEYDILRGRAPDTPYASIEPGPLSLDAMRRRNLVVNRRAEAAAADARRDRRHRRRTRDLLGEAGVLPWACWPGKDLPHAWHRREEFADAVAVWRRQRLEIAESVRVASQALADLSRAA